MRKMTTGLLVIVWGLALAGCAQAGLKGSAEVIKAAAEPAALAAAPGQRVHFAVQLQITERWHIYAHGDTNFIGVDLEPQEGFPLGDLQVEYPAGKMKEFFGDLVEMIEGKPVLRASALVPAGLAPGEYTLGLAVTAQACDDKTCLAPASIPVTVALKVE